MWFIKAHAPPYASNTLWAGRGGGCPHPPAIYQGLQAEQTLREHSLTGLIKQTNKEIPGEFLGRLVLGVEDGEIKIFGATIY